MARRKTKVRPEDSLLGNMSQEKDKEWIALNRPADRLPVSIQSTNATTTPSTRVLIDNTGSKLNTSTVDLQVLSSTRVPLKLSSPGMRRQANNIASCEKTLQENDPEIWSRKISLGSYAILHSEPNLDEIGSDESSAENCANSAAANINAAATDAEKREALHPSAEEVQAHEKDRTNGTTSTATRDHTERRALLRYFAKVTCSSQMDVAVDLEHMKSLLRGGVSVNESDDFGQTVLHEVSRVWGVDVAQFLVEEGADVNIADKLGRTPLHVAAAADYHDMARFLLEQGAKVEAETIGENQTPLHYAARNEAVQCVKTMLAYGAKIDARDYKKRTPLQTAAEHNSAEVAGLLLEKGAPAGVRDDSGLSALALLIRKMPNVALRALDQFHIVDRSHRKQHMYLNFLENCDVSSVKHSRAPSPLQAAVDDNCFELLMHPIVQVLIDVKWKKFGRVGAWVDIFPNLLLTILCTVMGVFYPTDVGNYYQPLSRNYWRIILDCFVIALTANEIRKEVKEYYRSKRENTKWKQWRTTEIKRDLEFCHPRWVQEKAFVEREIYMIRQCKKAYFQDLWNYLDWVAYLMLIVVFIMHYINIALNSNLYNDIVIKIMASTLILIWVRMLKFARPFPTQGPFVVMLDHIIIDTFKWSFLLAMIYIPYGAAFWMVFGGRTDAPVKGYESIPNLIFTMIRFPLVDDYNFPQLEEKAPIMSRVLCGTLLVIGAIILMNMYIALLSNTFQRVYDNAKATAAMQRARWIQDIESSLSRSKVAKYRDFIRKNCSPAQRDYLVMVTDEEIQDRKQGEKIFEIHSIVSKRLAVKKRGKTAAKSDFDVVLEDVSQLKVSQTEIKQLLVRIEKRLSQVSMTNAFVLKELNDLKSCRDEIKQLRESLRQPDEVKEAPTIESPPELFKHVEPKQAFRKVKKKRKERSGHNHQQHGPKEAEMARLTRIYGAPNAANSLVYIRKEDGYSSDNSTGAHSA